MNTFGRNLTLTTFGESHGPAVGGVLDGFPPGFAIDFDAVAAEMSRRRPGASPAVSARNEKDRVEFLSGFSPDGVTLGTPIAFMIRNTDARSGDYDRLKGVYRPNHADLTYEMKYGIRDHRGGGRASARETASWVAAGALARQWLSSIGITVRAVLSGAGPVADDGIMRRLAEMSSECRLSVSEQLSDEMMREVLAAKKRGDSIGGKVTCLVTGIPAGVGDPVFDKLQSRLAAAMTGINAVKGFEYGLGFAAASACGSETADRLTAISGGHAVTATNFSGGIQGGISNGMPVFFSVAFKPTPTLMMPMQSLDRSGRPVTIEPAGRHDPCVAVRGVPVVEAMAALTVADLML